jgi:hypothetical protein
MRLLTDLPVIDRRRGGTIDGVIDGLIASSSLDRGSALSGTLVVPGRTTQRLGRRNHRDMVTIIRDRVGHGSQEDDARAGQAAKPTADYEPLRCHDRRLDDGHVY